MPRLPRNAALAAVAAVLASLTPPGVARADEVVLAPEATIKAPGNRLRGTIQEETPTEVKIDGKTVPLDQVAAVNYDGLPPSMILAETRESAGALGEAAEHYQKAAAEASGKPLIAREAQFRRARILADASGGDPRSSAAAVTALESFVKANPKSRQLAPALERLARLHLQREEFDAAEKALADLARVPWAADRAAVMRARVLSHRGQHEQALTALEKIPAGKGASTARDIELARAEALAGLKRFDDAEAAVRQVIQSADPEDADALALAYNTLGDCQRAAGKPKDALLAYLHTDLLYSRNAPQHARALAQIAQLWRRLGQIERAEEAVDKLRKDYPESPWLAAAEAK